MISIGSTSGTVIYSLFNISAVTSNDEINGISFISSLFLLRTWLNLEEYQIAIIVLSEFKKNNDDI